MKFNYPALLPAKTFFQASDWFLAITLIAVVFAVGCDLPDRPQLEPVRPAVPLPTDNPVNDDDSVKWEPPTELDEPTWETWDAYLVNNEHVGYSHVRSSPATSATPGDVHFDLDHRIYQTNGNARSLQRLTLQSDESKDGRLVGFDGAMQVGLSVTRFSGTRDNTDLIVEIRDGSDVERREIPWQYNYRGMFAVEQSLRAKPMIEKGETRSLKMLISGQYQLATAKLRCSGTAVVPMLEGSERELIEINVELQVDGSEPIYSAIWTDAEGNVVRTYSSILNLIAYRTDRETAVQLEHDDLVPVSIEVGGKMERQAETKRVAYLVKQLVDANGQLAEEIKPAPGQYVRTMEHGEMQVLVSRQEEQPTGGFIDDQPAPTKADRRSNYFIDSRSEMVTQFANATIGSRKLSELEIAIELAGTTQRNVILTPEICGLAKASEIARVTKGDCLQRSILLAALLRAKKIPARIAIGLQFAPATESPRTPQRMVSHVWTMAYIKDHWVHLDAANGGLAAADRLMFESTSLSQEDQNESFRALTREIGRMEIEVLVAKY